MFPDASRLTFTSTLGSHASSTSPSDNGAAHSHRCQVASCRVHQSCPGRRCRAPQILRGRHALLSERLVVEFQIPALIGERCGENSLSCCEGCGRMPLADSMPNDLGPTRRIRPPTSMHRRGEACSPLYLTKIPGLTSEASNWSQAGQLREAGITLENAVDLQTPSAFG
ncbi:hypothetical protein CMUS01_06191 [Colletotrichum musicola]|uniref:Uncharacterized protein n=1 Tax=Colletotrichum musicola TaxID=2175873 RepID=A0A8H6NHZ6_9PEZI|nr:hypothetical protein CMUS01_06191 [Colletotrichum musicola]